MLQCLLLEGHSLPTRIHVNLGMIFNKTHDMTVTAEHVLAPFMVGCRRIRQFASEHHLTRKEKKTT